MAVGGGTVSNLADGIEANGAEFLLAMGRAGGGVERNDERLAWTVGGSPIDYHNCVVRADLPEDAADESIASFVRELDAHGVAGSWHVGPSMRPADLGRRLLRHGFELAEDEIGMAIDLSAMPHRVPAPARLSITRVRDNAALTLWATTLARGFGEGQREASWVGATYARIGLGDDVPWRHYLGTLDGEPVATTSLFFGAGVAGIYFVLTVAGARRQGIGAAITLSALQKARSMGFRTGVLQASAMGEPVYRRLGFREHCRIGIYEWRPAGG